MATSEFWEKCQSVPDSDIAGAIRASVAWYEGHSIVFCCDGLINHKSASLKVRLRFYDFDLVPAWFA